ncbi:MAG TPA: hypothetical protein VEJ38_01265 [Candidatus Acidoferrales bacterium]|nr:hypothetical protein [Candidatus Acidoferrales bacterium]
MDDRLGREEVDAAEFAVGERAAFARGLALLVDIGEKIGFEDAHHEAVEGVAMRGAEEIAALRGARTRGPGRVVSRGMNEAGAERHGDVNSGAVRLRQTETRPHAAGETAQRRRRV